jgi:hypothetical protein
MTLNEIKAAVEAGERNTKWMNTEAVRLVGCPHCGSPAGEGCVTPKGRKTNVHWQRTAALPEEVKRACVIKTTLPEFLRPKTHTEHRFKISHKSCVPGSSQWIQRESAEYHSRFSNQVDAACEFMKSIRRVGESGIRLTYESDNLTVGSFTLTWERTNE